MVKRFRIALVCHLRMTTRVNHSVIYIISKIELLSNVIVFITVELIKVHI